MGLGAGKKKYKQDYQGQGEPMGGWYSNEYGLREQVGSKNWWAKQPNGGNRPTSDGGSGGYDSDVSAITAASKATQKSAGVDRERALKTISDARAGAMGEYGNVSPEVISQKTQEMMMGKARDTAEAERGSMLRNLQNSYYGGSAPSGALLQKSTDIDLAKMGTLASARRDIMTESAGTNWNAQFALAGAKAGVHTGLVPTEVSTLGNTIATVPELGGTKPTAAKQEQIPQPQPGEGNVDFSRRDPEGFKKYWTSRTSPNRRI